MTSRNLYFTMICILFAVGECASKKNYFAQYYFGGDIENAVTHKELHSIFMKGIVDALASVAVRKVDADRVEKAFHRCVVEKALTTIDKDTHHNSTHHKLSMTGLTEHHLSDLPYDVKEKVTKQTLKGLYDGHTNSSDKLVVLSKRIFCLRKNDIADKHLKKFNRIFKANPNALCQTIKENIMQRLQAKGVLMYYSSRQFVVETLYEYRDSKEDNESFILKGKIGLSIRILGFARTIDNFGNFQAFHLGNLEEFVSNENTEESEGQHNMYAYNTEESEGQLYNTEPVGRPVMPEKLEHKLHRMTSQSVTCPKCKESYHARAGHVCPPGTEVQGHRQGCDACSKVIKKRTTPHKWTLGGWRCDCDHQGDNDYVYDTDPYGCETLFNCDWCICEACYNAYYSA